MAEHELYETYQVARTAAGKPDIRPAAGDKVTVKLERGGRERQVEINAVMREAIPAWGKAVEGAYTNFTADQKVAAAARAIAARAYFESRVDEFCEVMLPGGNEDQRGERKEEMLRLVFGAARIAPAELPAITADQCDAIETQLRARFYPAAGVAAGAPPAVGDPGRVFYDKFRAMGNALRARGWMGAGANQISFDDAKDLMFGVVREEIDVVRERARVGDVGKVLNWEKDGPLAIYGAGVPEGVAVPVGPATPQELARAQQEEERKTLEDKALNGLVNAEIRGSWEGQERAMLAEYLNTLRPTTEAGMRRKAWLEVRRDIVVKLDKAADPTETKDRLPTPIEGPRIAELLAVPGTYETFDAIRELCGLSLPVIDVDHPLGWLPKEADINRDDHAASYDFVLTRRYGVDFFDRHGLAGPKYDPYFRGDGKRFMKLDGDSDAEKTGFRDIMAGIVVDELRRRGIAKDDRAGLLERDVQEIVGAMWAWTRISGIVAGCVRWGEGHNHPMTLSAESLVEHPRELIVRRAVETTAVAGYFDGALRAQRWVQEARVREPALRRNPATWGEMAMILPGDNEIYSPFIFRQVGVANGFDRTDAVQAAKLANEAGLRNGTAMSLIDFMRVFGRAPRTEEMSESIGVPEANARKAAALVLDECLGVKPAAMGKERFKTETSNQGWVSGFKTRLKKDIAVPAGMFDRRRSDNDQERLINQLVVLHLAVGIGLQERDGVHLVPRGGDQLDVGILKAQLEGAGVVRDVESASVKYGLPERPSRRFTLWTPAVQNIILRAAAPLREEDRARDHFARNFGIIDGRGSFSFGGGMYEEWSRHVWRYGLAEGDDQIPLGFDWPKVRRDLQRRQSVIMSSTMLRDPIAREQAQALALGGFRKSEKGA